MTAPRRRRVSVPAEVGGALRGARRAVEHGAPLSCRSSAPGGRAPKRPSPGRDRFLAYLHVLVDERGYSATVLGDVLEVSRERVRQYLAVPVVSGVDVSDLPSPVPVVAQTASEVRAREASERRVARDAAREVLTEVEVARLVELAPVKARRRAGQGPGDEAFEAQVEFSRIVVGALGRGVSAYAMSQQVGLTQQSIKTAAARAGVGRASPSVSFAPLTP